MSCMESCIEIGMVGGWDFQCSNGRRRHHERESVSLVGGGREELRGAW